jgi:hypothetical protein
MGNFQTVHIRPTPPRAPSQPPPEYIEDFVNLTEDEKTIVTTYISETIDEIKGHVQYDNVPISFVFPVALKVNENKYFYLINALSCKCLSSKHESDMKTYNEKVSYHKLFYIVNNKIKEYTNTPYTISGRNGQFQTYTQKGGIVTSSMAYIYQSQDDKTSQRYGITNHPYGRRDAYDVFYLDLLFVQ